MMHVINFRSPVFYTQIKNRKKEDSMNATKKLITKDSVIGDVIRENPGAKDVIQKYFGGGCFTCPGINMESISFGSMMHNLDPEKIVKEINELAD
jgi:hybrid cluster-associated redox disulfide protein